MNWLIEMLLRMEQPGVTRQFSLLSEWIEAGIFATSSSVAFVLHFSTGVGRRLLSSWKSSGEF
jgi:hypothetical protein